MKPLAGAAEIHTLLGEVYLANAADPYNGKAKAVAYERIKQEFDLEEAEKFLAYVTFFGATIMPAPVINNHGTIGTLITDGQVDTLTTVMNVVSKQGVEGADFANSLKILTEAVASAADLEQDQKRNALELLSSIGKEALAPPHERGGVITGLLEALPKILSSAASLSSLWAIHGTHVLKFFGL